MTTRQIESAKPGAILWDDQIRGLHVRIFPNKRTFYLKCRTRQGKQLRPKLGDYGTITLPRARELAREKVNIVLAGGDPSIKPAPQKTVRELYDECLKTHYKTIETRTLRNYKWAWDKRILPALGQMKLDDVTEQEVLKLRASMSHGPVQSNRVLATLKAAFNLAEGWGWRPRHTNPVQVKLNGEEPRERVPEEDEAFRLLLAIKETEKRQPIFANYIWLLAFTGGRPGEILKARHEWVTPAGIVVPRAKRRKKGRLIELSDEARRIIKRLHREQDNPHLFPGKKPGSHLVGVQKMWEKLLDRAGVTGLQMRDLRKFFASLALSKGEKLDQIGQVLGHARGSRITERNYAFLLRTARRRVAEAAASELIRIRGLAKRHGRSLARRTLSGPKAARPSLNA